MKLLPAPMLLIFSGCAGLTALQLQDYAISTAIQTTAVAIVNFLLTLAGNI